MRQADRLERDARVVQRIRDGFAFERIAEEFLLSVSGVQAIALRNGLPNRRKRKGLKPRSLTPEEINAANRAFWANPANLVAYGWKLAIEASRASNCIFAIQTGIDARPGAPSFAHVSLESDTNT